MTGPIAGNSDSSLIKWAEGLRLAPDVLRELADFYLALAREAEDVQPLARSLRESIRRVAARCVAAAERADPWYQIARTALAADFAAYESPRDGSLAKERRSDVLAGQSVYQGRHSTAGPGPEPAREPVKKHRPLRDALKLAGKAPVAAGETLIGSSKVDCPDGVVRIAVTVQNGHRRVRLGLGGEGFGARDDEAGPWWAGPDTTGPTNAERRKVRAEAARIEARLAEIAAADIYAKVAATRPGATFNDLNTERARVHARLAEIREHDQRVARARERAWAGEQVDPSETDPPPFCAPGEYDDLDRRRRQLRELDKVGLWEETPRAAEPGEQQDLERRSRELDKVDTNEVHPSGYTAQLDADVARQLCDTLRPAIQAANTAHAETKALWDRIDQLVAERDRMAGETLTGEDEARLDQIAEEIQELRDRDAGYRVFAEGRVSGDWADVHYRVELDQEVDVILGAVQHGSDRDLTDLHGSEQAASFRGREADKVVDHLEQAIGSDPPVDT